MQNNLVSAETVLLLVSKTSLQFPHLCPEINCSIRVYPDIIDRVINTVTFTEMRRYGRCLPVGMFGTQERRAVGLEL
jgi:hypothetical protein